MQVFAVSLGKNSGKNSGHDLPEGDPVSVAPGMVFYVHVRLQCVSNCGRAVRLAPPVCSAQILG